MIKSRSDLEYYLKADNKALNVRRQKPRLIGDEVWSFQILLRRYEYLVNCSGSNMLLRVLRKLMFYRYHTLGTRLGFTIPPNVFGPGPSIAHVGSIVVHDRVRVGKNCRIHVGVNIGTAAGGGDSPILGNNIYIGPGAKLFGAIVIADDIAIGANAVVNRSFETPGCTIAGVPARVVSMKGSRGFIIDEVDS